MEELVKGLSEKFGLPIGEVWNDLTGLLERLVNYHIILNIVGIVVGVILLVIGTIGIKWVFNSYKDSKKLERSNILFDYTKYNYLSNELTLNFFGFCVVFTTVLLILIGIVVVPYNIGELIKWITIPEIQILEWLRTV